MWKKIAAFLGLSYLSYQLYKSNYIWTQLSVLKRPFWISLVFSTSQDIHLKDYICEVGHVEGIGSCLRLKDKTNTEIVFSKLIKTDNLIDKENTIMYHFDGDIILTFRKNKEKIESVFQRNGETIEWDVTDSVKKYKNMSFDTDFDLLLSL